MKPRPFHHQRPLAAAAACLGLGVWAGVRFAWRPYLPWTGLILCLAAAALLPRAGRRRIAGWMGAFLFAGVLLSGYAAHRVLPPPGKYRFTGVLTADASLRENGSAAAYLESVTAEGDAGAYRVGKAYWTYYPDEKALFLPKEGERVAFAGRLYLPSGQMNPYGFNARMFHLQKGAAAGISGAGDPEITGRPGRGLLSVTYRVRAWLERRTEEVFGEDAALPKALLLGIRDALPEDTRRAFSDAGIAHILAVSGLHVALLTEALMLPLRRLLGRKGRLGALAAFLAAYCALLNFSAPVVRASLLMLMAEGRRLARRAPDPLTALSAAFLLILIFRPLDLFSAGFQLSFAAALGIAVLVPPLKRRLEGLRFRRAWESLAVTGAASLGAAIPTVQVFHRLSPLGLLINPPACVALGAVLPLYALALLAGCAWLPAGQAMAAPLNAVSRWAASAAEAAGAVPFASLRVPFLPWYCVLALAMTLAVRYTVWPGKRKAAAAAALLLAAFAAWPLTESRDVRYIQLAAGQADAAVILDGGETAVIDAGEYGGDLADYLLSTGRRADHLILTHLHRDHCMGVRQLLDERIPIGTVYLPEGAESQRIDESCRLLLEEIRARGVPVRFLAAGDRVKMPRTALQALWPRRGTVRPGQEANRFCLCLLCDLDGTALLNAADLPGDYEHYAARAADVLKAAHHGSKSATGEAFLSAVSPRGVIFTGSGGPTARLPHPDTLSRVEERGVPFWNTGETGAVTVTVREGQALISTYLSPKELP